MGFSLAYLAFKNRTPEQVHEMLGLQSTGEQEEYPGPPIMAAMLPSRWYLVTFHRKEFQNGELAKLSAGLDLHYGFVEEHVMFSIASMWSDGRLVWSVEHDAQDDITHLKCTGELPAAFAEIRDTQLALQNQLQPDEESVDYVFDIPVELTRQLLGFRYDQGVEGAENQPFTVLKSSKRKGLLSFLTR